MQVKNVKFRLLTSREKEILAQKEEKKHEEKILDTNLLNYLDRDYDQAITNILVREDEIIIRGKISNVEKVYLAEIPVYENVTELDTFQFLKPIKSATKNFQVGVD